MLGLKGACIHPTSQKPYIKSLSGGRDNSKEGMQVSLSFQALGEATTIRSRSEQAGIQYGFVVEFDNLEDRDYYVEKDEAHEAFKNSARPIIEKVIVVDYSF